VNNHSRYKHQKHITIGEKNVGNKGSVPSGTNLPHHRLRRVPSSLIGYRRIQVGTRTEEKTGERNEDESLEDSPRAVQPRNVPIWSEQRVKVLDQCANEDSAGPDATDVPNGRGREPTDDDTSRERDERRKRTPIVFQTFPEFVNEYAQSVETAPDDEIPTGAVPKTTKQHRIHIVDIGRNRLSGIGKDEGDKNEDDGNNSQNVGQNNAAGNEDGYQSKKRNDEISGDGSFTISTERNVQVIFQPIGKGNVPAFPEIARVGGFVRRIEVLRQIETHQHSHTDGNVGVTGKIGIDLQRVDEKGRQIFKGSEQDGIIEDTVHEIDREVVTHNDFFGQTIENPEKCNSELPTGKEVLAVQLRHKLVGTDNRSGDQAREETDIKPEVQNVGDGFYLSAIDIYQVTDTLENIERDTDGEQDFPDIETGR